MIWLRRLSWLMTAAAAGLLLWTGFGVITQLHNYSVQEQVWNQGHSGGLQKAAAVLAFKHPTLSPGQQIAKMEIPAIGYTAILLEGNNDQVLANGPGHYIGSAYPGEPDTMIVSEHNTFILGLPELKKGDQVIFSDEDGRFVYEIDGSRIVDPGYRGGFGLAGKPTLEISSCWPIWAGAFATQRLVMLGHLVTP